MKKAIMLLMFVCLPAMAQSYVGIGFTHSKLNGPMWQGQVDTKFDQYRMATGGSASASFNEKVGHEFGGRLYMGYKANNDAIEVGITAPQTFKSDVTTEIGYGKATTNLTVFDASYLRYYRQAFMRVGFNMSHMNVKNHTWIFEDEAYGDHTTFTAGGALGFGVDFDPIRVEYIRYTNLGLTDKTGEHTMDTFSMSYRRSF